MNGLDARSRETLQLAVEAAARTTGLSMAVHGSDGRRAVTLAVGANRRTHRFRPEVQNADRLAIPAILKARERGSPERVVLVALYVSREVAQRCRELDLPFVDTAGNACFTGPDLYVYVAGMPRPEGLRRDQFRAFSGAGMRVVFSMLCEPRLLLATYREIARFAGVALGTVGPVLRDLEQRHHLVCPKGGVPKLVDAERLLQEWVTQYPVALRPKLNVRRLRADPGRVLALDLAPLNALWGGEVAAGRLTHSLKAEMFTIYTPEPMAKIAAAGRMRVDGAGNVEIVDQFWGFAPAPGQVDCVPPILVYADLLASGEPRNAEAAALMHSRIIAGLARDRPS